MRDARAGGERQSTVMTARTLRPCSSGRSSRGVPGDQWTLAAPDARQVPGWSQSMSLRWRAQELAAHAGSATRHPNDVRAVDAGRSITAPTQKNVSAVVRPHLLFATCQPTIGASAALPVARARSLTQAIAAVAAAELGGPRADRRRRNGKSWSARTAMRSSAIVGGSARGGCVSLGGVARVG
jgi:hypothetical protein